MLNEQAWIGWGSLFCLCAALAGCGKEVPGAPSARKGVITMAPHLTEAVFALGQGSRVIAAGSFCDYPPEIADLPRVGGYIDPELEKISLLNPELLIVPGKHQQVADYAEMKKLPVLNVDMDSLGSIDAGIETIGKALGCEDKAKALRARIASELDAVRAAIKDQPRPTVLIITTRPDHGLNNLYTVNAQSFVSEVVACAGGDNVYAGADSRYLEASKETVVIKAPEVIIEFHAGEKLDDTEQAKFVADWQQLPSLPAVQNGHVYLIGESHALRPGPRVGEIARIIARKLHPNVDIPEP